ncbi:MAG: hypothetical protein KGJ78_07785 [Alphaproteobacteria bacterium]|nr:hypothetical protein [Alphaproteobacteria bacterium]
MKFILLGTVAIVAFATVAWAHPGGGMGGMMGGGPPAGVTMGPPAGANGHGDVNGDAIGNSADVNGQAHASAGSDSADVSGNAESESHDKNADTDTATSSQIKAANELGKLNAVHANAMALKHASSKSTVGAIATYDQQMKAALALNDATAQANAITAARQQLATSTGMTLTASMVTKIDGDLGISGASSSLGTTH